MIVRLRKLGRGSKIELLKGRYRRYNGFTVGEILEKGTPYYPLLGFIYYNKSELSFVDDVLEELRITGDYTIDKPNADEEMCDKWLSNQFTNQEQKEVGDRKVSD